jgi:hypothetical protein
MPSDPGHDAPHREQKIMRSRDDLGIESLLCLSPGETFGVPAAHGWSIQREVYKRDPGADDVWALVRRFPQPSNGQRYQVSLTRLHPS